MILCVLLLACSSEVLGCETHHGNYKEEILESLSPIIENLATETRTCTKEMMRLKQEVEQLKLELSMQKKKHSTGLLGSTLVKDNPESQTSKTIPYAI